MDAIDIVQFTGNKSLINIIKTKYNIHERNPFNVIEYKIMHYSVVLFLIKFILKHLKIY